MPQAVSKRPSPPVLRQGDLIEIPGKFHGNPTYVCGQHGKFLGDVYNIGRFHFFCDVSSAPVQDKTFTFFLWLGFVEPAAKIALGQEAQCSLQHPNNHLLSTIS